MTKALIIESSYYADVASFLRQGVQTELKKDNIDYDIISVPGALEIPAALNLCLRNKYDIYIVLGCVIRGETSHYDIVCNESARGIYNIVLEHKLALGNAILTVENKEQALKRADPEQKNKGRDAVRAALAIYSIKKSIISYKK